MNMSVKERLLSVIAAQPEASSGGAIVTIEEFFTGNSDLASIGCNLKKHPGLGFFQKCLEEIRSRVNVEGVWLQIYDTDEGDWPFSESDVHKLAEKLEPSEIWRRKVEAPHSRDCRLVGPVWNLWWD